MTDISINALKKFCAPEDDVRDYLTEPFYFDGHIYATDGFIMVRVSASSVEQGVESVTRRLKDLFEKSDKTAMSTIPCLPDAERCPSCDGKGIIQINADCPGCDGEGEFYHCYHWYECKTCCGTGKGAGKEPYEYESCHLCGGTGEEPSQPVAIGESLYSRRYLKMLHDSFSNIRISGGPGASATHRNVGGYITFDGGDGVLMGIRK